MKKTLSVFALLAAVSAFSAVQANATGPYCITLGDYCDKVQLEYDASGNLYGHWDADCSGNFSTLVLGSKAGLNTTGTLDWGAVATFYFNLGAKTYDLNYYDGDYTGQFQNDSPFTLAPGACVAPTGLAQAPADDMPRSTD